jgi:hypothetical protein
MVITPRPCFGVTGKAESSNKQRKQNTESSTMSMNGIADFGMKTENTIKQKAEKTRR